MTFNDRRQEPRVDTLIDAKLSGTEEVSCKVANLSRSGALAVCSIPLPEMAHMKVRLNVAAVGNERETSLVIEAAVVRCERRTDGAYDLGLFFTNITPDVRVKLDSMIKAATLSPA
ncbi:MAG: PilZ domain-containing protein [Planctomycetes bacterium]|nr:PilZ domain-containing protein [Planctomycetota bacterium]